MFANPHFRWSRFLAHSERGFARLRFAGRCCGLHGQFFAELAGVGGVFMCLFAEFVSGEMISFFMGNCGGGMGVRRQIVDFRYSIMRAL